MNFYPTDDETVCGLHKAVADGTRTCEQIARECLARIERDEPTVRAWVRVDAEGLLDQARTLDAERKQGILRGPLHGVPVGIKDIVDIAGAVTGAGSPWMARRSPADRDATLVERLRRAGAMIPGKTVTTQFACFDPPPTRNPWNAEHTPGGSSSGSAAAVAVGMIPAAIGSQTGGSITRPASFCGIAGCKPTFGTVPVHGVVPVAVSLDHPGPMARTVRDLAVLLFVLQGRNEDPAASGPYLQTRLNPPRLARLRGFHEDVTDPEMSAALDETLNLLREAGAEVVDIRVPDHFEQLAAAHKRVMAVEAATWHRQFYTAHRADYGPAIASLIDEGLAASACDYVAARELQRSITSDMQTLCQSVDALVTPAAAGPAPDVTTTGNPCMNAPWSFTGLPTVCLPMRLSSAGLPLGMQLAGRLGADFPLLATAAWAEDLIRRTAS